jgi:hypothetical protein
MGKPAFSKKDLVKPASAPLMNHIMKHQGEDANQITDALKGEMNPKTIPACLSNWSRYKILIAVAPNGGQAKYRYYTPEYVWRILHMGPKEVKQTDLFRAGGELSPPAAAEAVRAIVHECDRLEDCLKEASAKEIAMDADLSKAWAKLEEQDARLAELDRKDRARPLSESIKFRPRGRGK